MMLSVSTWSAHRQLYDGTMSKEEFVRLLYRHGITGMEVVDIDFQDPSFEGMKELKTIGERYGVGITCMSLEHDLCQYTKAGRQADVDKVKGWMETAKKLNVKNVRVFTGWYKEGVPYHRQMKWVYEGMGDIIKKAEELDLNLVLENHDNVCFGADEIVELIGDLHAECLYTCPDVYNYKTFDESGHPLVEDWSFEEIEKLLPFARNAHIKICRVAEGSTKDVYLDIGRMRRLLEKYEYSGPVALEFVWPFLEEGENHTEALENAIEVLKYQMLK